MIGFLRGTALDLDLVDVGGVGYSVTTPHLMAEGEVVELWVHTVVREDALDLFGFASKAERDLFRLLIKVSGVGPRVAVGILAQLGAAATAVAIAGKDDKALACARGIGAKTAQAVVTAVTVPQALLDELGATKSAAVEVDTDDVLTALTRLGYPEPAARSALAGVRAEHGTVLADEVALRLALTALAAA